MSLFTNEGRIAMRRLIALLLLLCLAFSFAMAEDEPFSAPEGTFLPEGESIQTESSYQSQNIAINITSMYYDSSDVYIADIYVRSLDCFQRVYAGGEWGKTTARVKNMAADSGAILAMTGDSGQVIEKGWCIGNGTVWRSTTNRKRDIAILYKSGEMKTFLAPVDYEALEPDMEDIWHCFLFGPVLLDAEGKAMTKFNSNVGPRNPRSAIGYYAPGHYCFVQVDGRKTSSALEKGKINKGITLVSLSQLMEELGCTAAYNLDGGQSSMMWFGGDVLSTPYKGGRRVGDAVMIKELED